MRVVRELAEQRAESVDERAVDVVGEEHQVGPLLQHLADRPRSISAAQRDGVRVAGVDDEERLDRGVEQRRRGRRP